MGREGKRQMEERLKGRSSTEQRAESSLSLPTKLKMCGMSESNSYTHKLIHARIGWMDKHTPRRCAILINGAL